MLSIYSANHYHPLAGAAPWTPPIFDVSVVYWPSRGGINKGCCCLQAITGDWPSLKIGG